jgi:hypothetical protein
MLPEIHRDHKKGEFLKNSLLVSAVFFRWNREGSRVAPKRSLG